MHFTLTKVAFPSISILLEYISKSCSSNTPQQEGIQFLVLGWHTHVDIETIHNIFHH